MSDKPSRSFFLLCREIKKRMRRDADVVMSLSGYEGTGKSTLDILMGKRIDSKFDLDKNIAYMPTHKFMQEKFSKLKKYSYLGVDEAIKVLHKHRWMSRLQQAIVRLYATERCQNKCTGLCIPRFGDLNENFRNHRVLIWVHIIKRGYAVAFLKDDDKDVPDPWHMRENYKKKSKMFSRRMIADRTVDMKIRAEKTLPNYWFDFTFPPLENDEYNEYRRLREYYREKYRKENEDDSTTREERYKQALFNILNHCKENKIFDVKQMEKITQIPDKTIYRYLKKR